MNSTPGYISILTKVHYMEVSVICTLNWMSTFLFVFVPSGHRKSCGSCWSDDCARAFMSSLALCRLSGVLLKM